MTTDHSDSATASQTGEDQPAIEFVIRLHGASKAGLALLEAAEAWESDYAVSDDLARAIREARAAYDRLAETQERFTP